MASFFKGKGAKFEISIKVKSLEFDYNDKWANEDDRWSLKEDHLVISWKRGGHRANSKPSKMNLETKSDLDDGKVHYTVPKNTLFKKVAEFRTKNKKAVPKLS